MRGNQMGNAFLVTHVTCKPAGGRDAPDSCGKCQKLKGLLLLPTYLSVCLSSHLQAQDGCRQGEEKSTLRESIAILSKWYGAGRLHPVKANPIEGRTCALV